MGLDLLFWARGRPDTSLYTIFIQIVATTAMKFSLAGVWLLIEGTSYSRAAFINFTQCSPHVYCIAGNFRGRKLSWIDKKWPYFMEKTFAGGSKTAKFVNVFTLKSFPLYNRSAATLPWTNAHLPLAIVAINWVPYSRKVSLVQIFIYLAKKPTE